MKNNILYLLMPLRWILFALAILSSGYVNGQSLQEEDKKKVRETNKLLRTAEEELQENNFPEAEAAYRKAVAKNSESVTARYNMANMYYGKEKQEQAVSRYRAAAKLTQSKEEKHQIFHNLGNAHMKQKNYRGAVEAYKEALRNNPSDEETRYNLALAKKMLEENPEDPKGGGDEDKDQDKNEQQKDQGDKGDQDQDKKEGDNKDQGGEGDKDPKEQPNKEDENGQPKDQQPQGKEGEGDQKPREGQLSPEQLKRLLEAMNNEEKKVQEKINAQKVKGARTKNEKDW